MTDDRRRELERAEALLPLAESALADAGGDPGSAALRIKKRSGTPAEDGPAIRLALEIASARGSAGEEYGAWTRRGFFDRQMLEQSSRPRVSSHHARHFAGCGHVLEAGAGLGGDTAELAKVAGRVTALERDPFRAACLEKNLHVRGIENVRVVCADLAEYLPSIPGDFDGFWADPARRTEDGTRVFDPSQYSPALESLLLIRIAGVRGIKVGPGLNLELPEGWAREFLGFAGGCIEQTLWFGTEVRDRSAVLIDRDARWSPPPLRPEHSPTYLERTEVRYLIEPDPALIRTGELQSFFAESGLAMLDPHLAFGAASVLPAPSPWYEVFEVTAQFPFQLKMLREKVSALGWSSATEIKTRAFAASPEEIRRKLDLGPARAGREFGTILLTRLGDAPWAFLAQRIKSPRP